MDNTLVISHVITEYLWIGAGWGEAIFKLQNGKRYLFTIYFSNDNTFRIHELKENSTKITLENQVFNTNFYEDSDSAIDFLCTIFTDSEYDEIFEILYQLCIAYRNQSLEIFGEYSISDLLKAINLEEKEDEE